MSVTCSIAITMVDFHQKTIPASSARNRNLAFRGRPHRRSGPGWYVDSLVEHHPFMYRVSSVTISGRDPAFPGQRPDRRYEVELTVVGLILTQQTIQSRAGELKLFFEVV